MGRKRKISSGMGERLLKLFQEGEKQDEFAKRVGVADSTLGNYIRGDREPSSDFLLRLREKTGVDVNWLLTGQDQTALVATTSELVHLPRFDIQASAGMGLLVSTDQPNGLFAVDRDWLSRYVSRSANVGVIEAMGDSMVPTISNRDLLLVEVKEGATAEEIMRGGIYVLTLDGGLVVKRLEIDGNELVVISDNSAYPQIRISFGQVESRVIIHGVVFWSGGALETHR